MEALLADTSLSHLDRFILRFAISNGAVQDLRVELPEAIVCSFVGALQTSIDMSWLRKDSHIFQYLLVNQHYMRHGFYDVIVLHGVLSVCGVADTAYDWARCQIIIATLFEVELSSLSDSATLDAVPPVPSPEAPEPSCDAPCPECARLRERVAELETENKGCGASSLCSHLRRELCSKPPGAMYQRLRG